MKKKDQTVRRGPINPFLDWGFKYIFGREETKETLIGFLNLLLNPDVSIINIRYLNAELLGDSPDLKRCVVDVLATDDEGNRYLVEMQNATDMNIRERLVYYSCRLVDQMGQHSQDWQYGQIRRVYAICLMNFTYEPNSTLRDDVILRSRRDGRIFSDILNIITLQIPNLQVKSLTECRESYEILLFLLTQMSRNMRTTEELLAEIDALSCFPEETKEIFRRVVKTDIATLSEKEWQIYEIERDYYLRKIGEIRTGREEGRKAGLEEGRAEGRAEEKQRIAKVMMEHGVALETIYTCTGLTEDELKRL